MNLILEFILSWWILIPLLFYFVFEVEYNEAPIRASFVTLVIFTALQLFSHVHPFTYIFYYPLKSVVIFLLYFIIGTFYVWIKWYSFVHAAARRLPEWEHKFNSGNKLSLLSYIDKSNAATYCRVKEFPVRVSAYKSRIYGWMICWPADILWTLLDDPLRRFCQWIYNSIAKNLQSISDNAFKH